MNISNKIAVELMKYDSINPLMNMFDAAENKREFVLAMAVTLLMRHRQWQALSDHDHSYPLANQQVKQRAEQS